MRFPCFCFLLLYCVVFLRLNYNSYTNIAHFLHLNTVDSFYFLGIMKNSTLHLELACRHSPRSWFQFFLGGGIYPEMGTVLSYMVGLFLIAGKPLYHFNSGLANLYSYNSVGGYCLSIFSLSLVIMCLLLVWDGVSHRPPWPGTHV